MKHRLLRRLRRSYKKFFGHPGDFLDPQTELFDYRGQGASDRIGQMLRQDAPCMICRMGNTEAQTVMTYLTIQADGSAFQKSIRYIKGQTPSFWWDEKITRLISVFSGFFPVTEPNLARFCERILQDALEVDILGSWIKAEERLFAANESYQRIYLDDLEPYRHGNPWSAALEGKKVLVVHPFEDSIRAQYARREKLFDDPRILPSFELKTLKAVQSIAANNVEFADWFQALDWMCGQIEKIDFDIALIGAGAYGFPLAAHIKRLGKKAVHLGGASQVLFGIKGNRYDKNPFYTKLYNDYWTRPQPQEVPPNSEAVERACYW